MRRVFLNLRIALRSLYSFKLRTSLAILGVFLGTFSLIIVSNLSGSLAEKANQELEKLGKNLLILRSGTVMRFGSRTALMSEATNLTLEDAKAVAGRCRFVLGVSPSSHKAFPVRYRNTALSSILVTGVSPNYPEIRNFHVKEGCFFTEEDDRNLERVAVIGKKVADKLFRNEDPLGKTILVYRVPCRVIGVMEEKGVDISNVDQDNQIFVPVRTFMRRFVNKDYINTVYIQTENSLSVPLAKAEIESLMRERHKIRTGQKDDFTVIDLKDVMALKNQATAMISMLGRISAGISFAIGALGILSIMILIVNERKVEIGIRRAVGSRKRDIVLQFLIESSFISLLGGMTGVIAGYLISILVFTLSKLPFSFSPAGFVFSFIASVIVGILAGIYPSQKATTIQPMDILRS